MPLQNRVTPEGEIVAHPARGLMMGNRGGALHDANQALRRRRWVSRQWICCLLQFNGRHRQVMAPRRYTELFFLDEATALAAGHRPCFECRRHDFLRFARLWAEVHGSGADRATADDMDRVLHPERVDKAGAKVTYRADPDGLPDATFVRLDDQPYIVLNKALHPWSPEGYGRARTSGGCGPVDVLTPRSMVGILAAGYTPLVHASARS